ncbi:MAG: hypothetical protein FJ265_15110 [Planctomycetes bacterium]|nr:hypothetical protein [Planctomycetota bacterium]
MSRLPFSAALFCASAALAQTTIYVPDNDPTLGTCNAIPMSASFGAGSMTYIGRIPASWLDPNHRTIRDIEFAPCGAGTFTAPNILIGIGHVPNPLPVPFTFPTFDVAGMPTALGNFLDYAPLYNSVIQGPFTWTMTMNTWSPLGLGTSVWPGFTWDGVNDIGFYITYSGAAGGGACHRTTTEPFRIYASGSYQASTSSGSGAAGLKMGIVTGWPTPCGGCGSVTLGITGTASIGGSLTATVGNLGPGLPFLGVGTAPYCLANYCPGCTIGHNWIVALFGTTATLVIPNNPTYIGVQLGFQGIGLLSPGGCQGPDVAFTQTVAVTITQ